MTTISLDDLQVSLQDKTAFEKLEDYYTLAHAFLNYVEETQPTRIISPDKSEYIFYQYSKAYGSRITRPLNSILFFESAEELKQASCPNSSTNLPTFQPGKAAGIAIAASCCLA